MRIGILIYDEVEVLDACGPFEVFAVAARLQRHDGEDDPITVTMVSAYADRELVIARGGLKITADTTIADTERTGCASTSPGSTAFDVLVVPGGVTGDVERDPRVIAWIAAQAATPTIASVCTGVFLLAEAGILASGEVTTHWEDQAELARRFPALTVLDGPRWVQQGHVFTSAGISAGLDLALHLTGLVDPALPARVARQMDYNWSPPADPAH